MSLFQQKDIPVLIAINEKGIYVIDHVESVSSIRKVEKFLSTSLNANRNDVERVVRFSQDLLTRLVQTE